MGHNATAILYRGVVFPEDYGFPWGSKSIERWWLDSVVGFVDSVELYDEDGDFLGGVEPDATTVSNYYQARASALVENPLPVETAWAGGEGDDGAMIFAVWIRTASWEGVEVEIPPIDSVEDYRLVSFLMDHCQPVGWYDREHKPSFTPQLRLSSCYG